MPVFLSVKVREALPGRVTLPKFTRGGEPANGLPAGSSMTRREAALTMTEKVEVVTRPTPSVAVAVTVVTPSGKRLPLAGE